MPVFMEDKAKSATVAWTVPRTMREEDEANPTAEQFASST
jgi:hypothetical protein